MLVDLIVIDLQPFKIIEDKGFRTLINYLDPRYTIPCRKTLKKIVEDAYNEKRRMIQEELDAVSDVSITCDTWTSINVDNIISVTCHFINHDFQLKTYTLQTEKITGSHTGHALSQTLKNIFYQWNIHGKVKHVVTDNAANMLAAVRNLDESVCSVSCFAHTLNLVVKKSLAAVPDLVAIRQKCRRIVTYFKASCLAKDKLSEMQNALNAPKHKLILEIETRWNSTYEMFNRLIEQKQAITSALLFFHIPFDSLTTIEWEILIESLPILQPFYLLTMELSSETNVSISKINIAVKQLHTCLELHSDNSLSVQLKETMGKYFNTIETNSLYAMATILDPRFKVLGFLFSENAEKGKELIVNHILNMSVSEIVQTNNSTPVPSTLSLWTSFDNEVTEQNSISAYRFGPTNELENYLSDSYINRLSDPLQYWKNNITKYPNLAKLAKYHKFGFESGYEATLGKSLA
ncbi:PREDICTED: zinc finger BED domain-containing protein 4-like [Dufourea novaeangliae]|uniref:zinc finger BED domain-containing protein 4-like n=1 Tax=Dufourea novaeangliae TaxID=178035 RepID=UPI0007678327|nr:PREDICTED: zinc finger BED domain-containing protein 4-like [Dufourea novaeangliae]